MNVSCRDKNGDLGLLPTRINAINVLSFYVTPNKLFAFINQQTDAQR